MLSGSAESPQSKSAGNRRTRVQTPFRKRSSDSRMASHQPTDDELSSALRALRGAQPEAGIPKIHAALQEGHPDWVVSLKRTRKVLQTLGLVLGPAATALVPSYKLNEKLDVGKFSAKVRVKDFGMPRGKVRLPVPSQALLSLTSRTTGLGCC